MSITLKVINSLKKDEIFSIEINDKDHIIDVKKQIKNKSVYFMNISSQRIGIYIKIPNNYVKNNKEKVIDINNKTQIDLSSKNDLNFFQSFPYIINNKDYEKILYIYDRGYQISTPLANFIEYFLPVVILVYYIVKNKLSLVIQQKLLIYMIIIHYIKRVFESLFIHIQINTMEFKMFIIECLYYVVYYGIYCQKNIFKQNYDNDYIYIKYFSFGLFLFCELNNFNCHIILRRIRLYNIYNREIPSGNIFNYVYCANYFWEISSWINISFVSSLKSIYFFTFMGAVIMTSWALEKKKFYEKMLLKQNKQIPNKKAIFPFIL